MISVFSIRRSIRSLQSKRPPLYWTGCGCCKFQPSCPSCSSWWSDSNLETAYPTEPDRWAREPQAHLPAQKRTRRRVLRLFRRRSILPADVVEDMLQWSHAGGFSVDASVWIAAHDRRGLERLLRYCARPVFALERLQWCNEHHERLVYCRCSKPCPTAALPLAAHPTGADPPPGAALDTTA